MQPVSVYPQWYHTLRTFLLGAAYGATIVAIAAGETLSYPRIAYYVVILGVLVISGLLEAVFAVRRHHRLVHDLDRARSIDA